jgi:hypothetical protein
MTYSRKGFWISQAMAMGLVAFLVVYSFWMGPGGFIPYLSGAVLLVFCALSIRAFFYLDEIQRAQHMQIWAHGSVIGTLGVGLLIPFLQTQPALLDTLLDVLHHNHPHQPMNYFVAGFILLCVAQVSGSAVVYLVMQLRRGT